MSFRQRHRHPQRRRRFKKNGMKKVKKDIKWLKKNIEFKARDISTTQADLSLTGSSTRLNLVGQGDTSSSCDGNQVTSRRILIRGFVRNANGTPVDCVCRIIVCRQKVTNGQALDINDVVETTTVNSVRELSLAQNIVVYADETFGMDTTGHALIPFKFMFKLNHQCRYNGTGGTESDLESNGLSIIGISTVAGGANNPDMDFVSRYSYVDG